MSEQHVRVSVGRRTLLTKGGDKKGDFRAVVLSGFLSTTIVCLGMGGAAAKARFVDLYNGEDFTGWGMMEPGRFEIKVVGQKYTIMLNRVKINEFTGERREQGYIGLQNHLPADKVWFRNVRVLELK